MTIKVIYNALLLVRIRYQSFLNSCVLQVLVLGFGLEIWRPRTKPKPKPKAKDLPFITKAKDFSIIVKAKAKDFHTVLKNTSRPRTDIPEKFQPMNLPSRFPRTFSWWKILPQKILANKLPQTFLCMCPPWNPLETFPKHKSPDISLGHFHCTVPQLPAAALAVSSVLTSIWILKLPVYAVIFWGCCVQIKTFACRYFEDKSVERPFMAKFDLLVRGCYLFKGMPFLRVTFIDVCKAMEFINHSPRREAIVLAKRRELLTFRSDGNPLFINIGITEPV